MALKMDRQVDAVDIGFYLNEVAERGVIVSASAAGSGVALDSPFNVATVAAVASGSRPIGLLMNDFVNVDQTRTKVNWFKDQSQIGNKCTILTKGWVVTNKVNGTVNGQDKAVLDASGFMKAAAPGSPDSVVNPIVGRFRSKLSEDGYAKVYIDL